MLFATWSLAGWMLVIAMLCSFATFALLLLLLWRVAPWAWRKRETPLELAQRRYAAGRISREEYVEARSTLGKPAHFEG